MIGAEGRAADVELGHEAAWQRFATILEELVAELPMLRQPVGTACPLQGRIARRMWEACRPFSDRFITPMAAVAGSVAQELISAYEREGVERAWVNNGGDIALHLAPGSSVQVGLFADLGRLEAAQVINGVRVDGRFEVTHAMPVRGIATSGWRGRSFSLGIADSVTVLARAAAQADAAATVIANAVDIDDPRIVRRPANELKDDSDLGRIAVTVDVPTLGREDLFQALDAGLSEARQLQSAGLIWSSVIVCQGWVVSTDGDSPMPLPDPSARANAIAH